MRPGDRYIAVVSPIGASDDGVALAWFSRVLKGGGWREVFREPGLALAVPAGSRLRIRRLRNGRGLVLGDLYPKQPNAPSPGGWLSFPNAGLGSRDVLCALVGQCWGRYIALHEPRPGGPISVFRDPSGALDALTWSCGAGAVVASDLLADLPGDLRPMPTVDWSRVDAHLSNLGVGAAVCPALTGIASPAPGEMLQLGIGRRAAIWRPHDFVRAERCDPVTHIEALRTTVDHVVARLTEDAAGIVAEVSGGLDSAIVASALAPAAGERVAQWVNFHTGDREGDERVFARAVAARWGLTLTEASKSELRLTEGDLAFVGQGPRPSVAGLDVQYDQDNADRCAEVGADTLVTGQGGDCVFLQTRSPLLAIDAMRAGLGGEALWQVRCKVALAARTSVWRLAALGWWDRLLPQSRRRVRPKLFLANDQAAQPTHPWLEDLTTVPPAKRLHVHALASTPLFHGHSRRSRAVDVIHPLVSQPLMELCLGIPAFDLAAGDNDRPLARQAFADRLPDLVIRRQSKGDMGGYYGRMLARSLDVVRPYLLEGLLAEHGLLRTDRLDQALTADSLVVQDSTPDLLELLAVESWVKAWASAGRAVNS